MAETFRGQIKDLSSQGLGVVDHPEGRVFFVPGTWPGDEGIFEVESREKRYGFAKIIQLDQLSQDRITNPCPHSGFTKGRCGTCAWIFVRYGAQLEQKQKTLNYYLTKHLPGLDLQIQEIWPSPQVLGYRNRAQLKTEGERIGYVSPSSKTLAAVQDCVILSEHNRKTLKDLAAQLPRADWQPRRPYLWNFIDIDEGIEAKDIVLNQRRPFQQANSMQNQRMRWWLEEKLTAQSKSKKVLELFCGSGNFTEVLVSLEFTRILATEFEAQAVKKLQQREWPQVQAFAMDLFSPRQVEELVTKARDAEILVLDPPREGFRGLIDLVPRLEKLQDIYYISCEPHQFFQECKGLKEKGFALKEVQPLDQFPHTPHIELLAHIVRCG